MTLRSDTSLLVANHEPDDELVAESEESEDVSDVAGIHHITQLVVAAFDNHGKRAVEIEGKKLEATRITTEARPAERAHEQELAKLKNELAKVRGEQQLTVLKTKEETKRKTIYMGGFLLALVLGILTYAIYLGKDAFAADIVKIAGGMVAGGFGGYGLGVRKREAKESDD